MYVTANTPSSKKMNLRSVAKPFFTLFILMAILVGSILTILYFKETGNRQTALKRIEINRLNTKKEVINRCIQTIAADVLTVSKHYELRRLLNSDLNRHRESLAEEFLWFSKIKKIYDQVRFLDDRGMESLRVNFNDGNPRVVPNEKLQFKGERYYFKDTFQLSENEVFVSPFDLNIEQGKIERPLKPMIRFGTPVFDSNGKKRGVVLLNYLGADLLDTLKGGSGNGTGKFILLNSDGYFLHGMNRDEEWGFMFENKKDRTFARSYPEAWKKISKVESGQFLGAHGVFTFTTLRPFTEAQMSSTGSGKPYKASEKLIEGTEYKWKLISHIAPVAVPWKENPLFTRMLLLYAVMLALLAFGAALIAYASTKRKQAEKEVRDHRDHLKQMVEQRTAELTQVNEQLQNDISERKQVEKALRESEEKYRSMMESFTDPLYICSPHFKIEYMNPAMIKRIGYDATGESCHSGMHGLQSRCEWCVFDKVAIGETIEYKVKSPLDEKDFRVSNMPICNQDGTISKMTIFRDITDYLEAVSEKEKAQSQLIQAQKMEAIGTLASGIAHDFNNILSAVIGYTELSLEDVPRDSKLEDNLKEVYAAGKRAKDLVNQVLTFARQSEGEIKPVQVGLIAKEVLTLLRSSIPTSIEIKQNISSKALVMADPTQIHQVLMNLCTNAAQAMEALDDGLLQVGISDLKLEKNLVIGHVVVKPGDYLQITVADTGPGILRTHLNLIFEPYFTTKEIGEGTGLGLAVVHGAVKGMGGEIVVNSESGIGAVFTIYLPVTKSQTDVSISIAEDLPDGNEHILFVDDEVLIANMVGQILTRRGYLVTKRTSSLEALALFRRKPQDFDLVITDMTMPKMTGDKLAIELMKIRSDIPVVLITGYSKKISHETASEIGIKAFAYKPVQKSVFLMTVRKVLDEAKVIGYR